MAGFLELVALRFVVFEPGDMTDGLKLNDELAEREKEERSNKFKQY
jgi:hypothetical protein